MTSTARTSSAAGRAFITLVGTAPGTSLNNILMATAPITGVTIAQKGDNAFNKSLNSDFAVACFGDLPVSITIKGLCLYSSGCLRTTATAQTIPDFYKKFKLSKNSSARVKVSISWAASGVAFKCVLTGMQLDATSQARESCSYTLTFTGVEA